MEGALIGYTDSPHKKRENARVQRVTNFNLGHSGKRIDLQTFDRACGGGIKEAHGLPESEPGYLPEVQRVAAASGEQLAAQSLRDREPCLPQLQGFYDPQGQLHGAATGLRAPQDQL